MKSTIKQHEEFALYALISLIILGVASIIGLFITFKKLPYLRTVAFIILFLSFISFLMVARTGYLGGQIRHTETVSSTSLQSENLENEIEE